MMRYICLALFIVVTVNFVWSLHNLSNGYVHRDIWLGPRHSSVEVPVNPNARGLERLFLTKKSVKWVWHGPELSPSVFILQLTAEYLKESVKVAVLIIVILLLPYMVRKRSVGPNG